MRSMTAPEVNWRSEAWYHPPLEELRTVLTLLRRAPSKRRSSSAGCYSFQGAAQAGFPPLTAKAKTLSFNAPVWTSKSCNNAGPCSPRDFTASIFLPSCSRKRVSSTFGSPVRTTETVFPSCLMVTWLCPISALHSFFDFLCPPAKTLPNATIIANTVASSEVVILTRICLGFRVAANPQQCHSASMMARSGKNTPR